MDELCQYHFFSILGSDFWFYCIFFDIFILFEKFILFESELFS